VVRRIFEQIWNQRNFAAADELIGPNFASHDPASPDFGRGPESVKRLVKYYTDAFPDTHFTIDDMVSEGDRVVTRWTVRGTHQGRLGDLPPTNRQVTVTGIDVTRVSGGKAQELWNHWDALGMMRQLGAVVSMTRASG
jgi:steroid delta-isomerase-like uncharacterized protein